jgi:hypothetical protein
MTAQYIFICLCYKITFYVPFTFYLLPFTSPFQNLLNPAAYLRHTYAHFTAITHLLLMPKSLLRV